MNDKIEGYMNESFEHLINRLPKSAIFRHITFIKMELEEKHISEERKTVLNQRLDYCIKKLARD